MAIAICSHDDIIYFKATFLPKLYIHNIQNKNLPAMSLRITQYGEKILHEKGKTITDFSENLSQLANDMLEAMGIAEGIGLAAQQVGKALRFCVVDVPEHPEFPTTCIMDGKPLSSSLLMPMSLANPKIEFLPSPLFQQIRRPRISPLDPSEVSGHDIPLQE